MKKIILLFISFLMIVSFAISAQEVNVELTIKYHGDYKPDSVYIMFYPTVEVNLGERHPKPFIQLVTSELTNSFKIDAGVYTLGVLAQGYKLLRTPIIVPNDKKNYKLEVLLNPQLIGWGGITDINQIEKVTIWGDFNNFQQPNEISLIREGNAWKLDPVPDVLEEGKCYTFYVPVAQLTACC
ncbi:MAG: hypothetical protein HQ541_07670 [Mariniphaga sp.]|nr:hypothetical protein [Mariniphaga sp.]